MDRDTGNSPLLTLAFAFLSSFSPIPNPDEVPGAFNIYNICFSNSHFQCLVFFNVRQTCCRAFSTNINAQSSSSASTQKVQRRVFVGCCCRVQVWFKASCLWWRVVPIHGFVAETASALRTGRCPFFWCALISPIDIWDILGPISTIGFPPKSDPFFG